MLVLKRNRAFFKYLDLVETGKPFSLVKHVKVASVISIELFLVIPAIAYLLQNIASLRNATEAMYGVVSFSTSFGMYCIFLANRRPLNKLFADLQDIVDSRFDDSRCQMYQATENRISIFTRTFTIATFAVCSIILLRPFYFSLYLLCQQNFDPHKVSIPFKAVYPFDQVKPPGLFVAAAFEMAAGYKLFTVFSAVSTFYIGITWYVETCINDINTIYKNIDTDNQLAASDPKVIDSKMNCNHVRMSLKKALVELINFHSRILSFVESFARLMNGIIFLTFSSGIIWLSASFAQFTEFNVKLFQPTVSSILVLVWLYVYCSFSDLLSVKCEQVSDYAYASVFYHYPLNLRIFTLMTISRAQIPFFITGYKMTRCSLDSYKRLINTSVSFYMLFRNLALRN